MVAQIGFYCLFVALGVSAYGTVFPLLGQMLRRREYVQSSKKAIFVLFILLSLSVICLLYSLAVHNFSLEYVAGHTSTDLPLFYTVSALWAGQEGSLLFWELLLVIYTSVVVLQNRRKNQELIPFVISVMMGTSLFFLTVTIFTSNPFNYSLKVPQEGRGLNPLLQNPGMVIHPPILYLGYVGFIVPFAFAIAALATGRVDELWIGPTKKWMLFSWLLLGIGILFGARWAYLLLGWGGYWSWDPVENASLMPWLTATAYLHSVTIQEKRGILKAGNILLITLTFALSIFGTFLTRSGILYSVHSFELSPLLGSLFLSFMGGMLIVVLSLLLKRFPQLRSKNELESFLFREGFLLVSNLVLLGMTFAIFWGTVFPLISEAVAGAKISLGASFFNQIIPPFGLVLLALTGIYFLISWRRTSGRSLRKSLVLPVVAGFVGAALAYVSAAPKPYPVISIGLIFLVTSGISMEFVSGVRVRMRTGRIKDPLKALFLLVVKNRCGYEGLLIHMGMVLIILGITGSAYNVEKQAILKKEEKVRIQDYELINRGVSEYPTKGKFITRAALSVYRDSQFIGVLHPIRSFHPNFRQTVSEAAIYSTLKEDLYTVLLECFSEYELLIIKVGVFPLVSWIWIGGVVLLAGGVIALGPERKEERKLSPRTEN